MGNSNTSRAVHIDYEEKTSSKIDPKIYKLFGEPNDKNDNNPLRERPLGDTKSNLDNNYLPVETTPETTNPVSKTQPNSFPNYTFPIFNARLSPTEVPREIILQEWEGQVTCVDRIRGVFFATLTDLTARDIVESEEGEFPISDISDGDLELLDDGAIFRWIICYEYIGRQRRRYSRISFRRMPQWSESDIIAADREAEKLSAIKWD
jgi:hypothetical protein